MGSLNRDFPNLKDFLDLEIELNGSYLFVLYTAVSNELAYLSFVIVKSIFFLVVDS